MILGLPCLTVFNALVKWLPVSLILWFVRLDRPTAIIILIFISSHLIWHLMWPHLIWLVTATANWVSLHSARPTHDAVRGCDQSQRTHALSWGEMRWDEMKLWVVGVRYERCLRLLWRLLSVWRKCQPVTDKNNLRPCAWRELQRGAQKCATATQNVSVYSC